MRIGIIIVIILCTSALYSQEAIDIRPFHNWVHASIPQKQDSLFHESKLTDNLTVFYNRAKICWYSIAPLFYEDSYLTPEHIIDDIEQKQNHFVRKIKYQEVFPDYTENTYKNAFLLNIAYYPNEKGIYNFDVDSNSYSKGIDSLGNLNNHRSRWSGIMRPLDEDVLSNPEINYLGFWLMDPFVYDKQSPGGTFLIHLGDISEDILKDKKYSGEGFRLETLDTSAWGLVNDTIRHDISTQTDYGFDALTNEKERIFFNDYLSAIESLYGSNSTAYRKAYEDPSSDDYHYYRGSDYDSAGISILERYKKYNNVEHNTFPFENVSEVYNTSATNSPDIEDINRNDVFDTIENYIQYKIELCPEKLKVGQNYIADKVTILPENSNSEITWYKFMIPLKTANRVLYGIPQQANFIRFVLKDFEDPVVLRFLTLDFVNSESDIRPPHKFENITIYPNPTKNKLTIAGINSDVTIRIINSLGQEYYNVKYNYKSKITLNTNNFNRGVYYVIIQTPDGTNIKPVIKI